MRRPVTHLVLLFLLAANCAAQDGTDLVKPSAQPTLELPQSAPVGEFIDVAVLAPLPAGVTPTLSWKLDGQAADAKHLRVTSDQLSAVISVPGGKHELTVRGGWGVVVDGKVALTFIDLEGEFTVGEQPPTPPGPTPPTPPPTPTPPVVEGKRTVVIVHESADQTPAQSRLFNTLRNGTAASYIVSKGHTLLILDDDSVDQLNRPYKIVTDLVTLGDPLPLVGILDSNTGALLHHRPLTPAANAEGILAVLKEHGG